MKHDPLSDAFTILRNTESIGRRGCTIPASNLVRSVLKIMQNHKYIKGFDSIEDGKGGRLRIQLHGKINDCGVIRPRFSVEKGGFIKWEKRFLPASGVGILLVSTPKGVMDQRQAQKEKTGGCLLGYIY